jgi:3'(2'), 5'-bisphosphate nucleotidase
MLNDIKRIALNAGKRILEIYSSGTEVQFKADKSPLTNADQAAHDIISSALKSFTPDIPVVSEESDPEAVECRHKNIASWKSFWLVDPLDGTKEFLKKTGEFTVNIALIENGSPTLGIVYAPAIRTLYSGDVKKSEAVKIIFPTDSHSESREFIRVRSAPNPDRYRVVASKDHAGPDVAAFIDQLPGTPELKSMGSSLKFCLVAEGAADLYPRLLPTMEWDTAAAHAVILAAGGQVYNTTTGNPLTYGKPDLKNPHFIAVGNPSLAWQKYLKPLNSH